MTPREIKAYRLFILKGLAWEAIFILIVYLGVNGII
jgi:hypothetical protein